MKNVFGKKLKIACAGFLAACACVTAGICFSDNGNPTQANAEFVEAPVFQTVYDLNSTISIPSASLSYGSAQYPATAYLISPDGTVYSLNECTLDTAGKWQVMYKAQTDSGEIVSETLSFEVYSQIVSVGDKSTMEYTTFSNTHYSYEGYRIELAKGESIDYNRIIDLNEVTSKDDLFSLFVIPKNLGSADATRLIVTFTDIYDPENVVSVMLQQTLVDTTTWSYVTAKAPGQSYSGLYNQPRTGFDTVSIDGVDVGLFSGSIYGTQLAFSFVGNVHKYTGNGRRYYGEVGDQLFSLSWDYSQRRVYLPWHHTSQKVICDLDESYMKVDWDGFTTGEVMMSISADGYLSDTICLFVEDMNGENLSNNRFQDAKAPEIKLDFGAFDRDSLPVAVVGEKYPLFPAVAFDDYSGYLSYQTRVYYNYHNNMRVEVPVTDGAFMPTHAGNYKIVYSATDESGKSTEEIVYVSAKKASEVKTIISFVDQVTSGFAAGRAVTVADYGLERGTSDGVMTITATHGNDVYEVVDGQFLPMSAGIYEVKYEYKTYAFTATDSYSIEVGTENIVTFLEEAELPDYFITGAVYKLPVLSAYNFASGEGVKENAKIYLTEDNGDRTLLEDNEYTVEATSSVMLVYEVGGVEKSYERPAVDTGLKTAIDTAKYFYVTKGAATATANKGNITYTTTENELAMEFINSVLAEPFEGRFRGYGDGLRSIKFIFADATDQTNAFTVTVTNGYASVNGGEPFAIPSDFSLSGERIELAYSDSARTVEFSEKVSKTIDKTASGKAFTGFAEDKAVLSVEVSSEGGANFVVERINSQNFRLNAKDNRGPSMSVTKANGVYRKGDTVVIPAAYAADVLDPNVAFTLSITDPNGNAVIAADGTKLDGCDPTKVYEISLKEYGRYSVEYTATDSKGQGDPISYAINVLDFEAPTITLGEKVRSAKVGDVVKVASISVLDNISAADAIEVSVFVKDADGVISLVTDGKFEAKMKGIYTVMYAAYDEAGNMTSAYYTVQIG